MVKRMRDSDWERTKGQLASIAAAIRSEGISSFDVILDLAAAKRSLEEKRNPLQAGIELIAIADELANIPALWNRTVALASELLCYPAVERTARIRATLDRPIPVEHVY